MMRQAMRACRFIEAGKCTGSWAFHSPQPLPRGKSQANSERNKARNLTKSHNSQVVAGPFSQSSINRTGPSSQVRCYSPPGGCSRAGAQATGNACHRVLKRKIAKDENPEPTKIRSWKNKIQVNILNILTLIDSQERKCVDVDVLLITVECNI